MSIGGEIIIVPPVAGISAMEDELFTLNDTGKAVWEQLDGQRSLGEVVAALSPSSRKPRTPLWNATCSASSPSSSRAACWSPPEPGQGRRRRQVGAARRDVAALIAPPSQRAYSRRQTQ